MEIAPNQSKDEADFHLARFARIQEGNPITAEIMLKGILDRSPAAAPVRFELAQLYLDQKRFDEAKDQVIAATKDAPPEIRKQNCQNFAQILRQLGANSQADAILQVAESR